MAFRTIPYQFVFPARSGGEQTRTERYTSYKPITVAQALLTGFKATFNNGDHGFGLLQTRLDIRQLDPYTLEISATLALRDYSGNWDDPFSGTIDCSLLFETE